MNTIANATTPQELWQRLQQRGLVEGEQPPADASSSPWYVRVMLGIAGWIGACFLLGFVGIAFVAVMESALASILVGLLCCGGACFIFRAAKDNDFLAQFGLAVSFAGQGLVIYGIFKDAHSESALAFLLVAAFEAALALLVPNAIHRVLATAGAMLALAFAIERSGLHGVAPAIAAAGVAAVWLKRELWAGKGEVWRPIGYGLTLALLQIESTRLFDFYRHWFHDQPDWLARYAPVLGALLMLVVLVWATVSLLRQEHIALDGKAGVAALLAAVLTGVLSFSAPGVAAGVLILVLGFACGNRILLGLGLIGLLGFISHYYYQMHSTLLVKSAVLAITGIALLIARLALHQCFPSPSAEENPHA